MQKVAKIPTELLDPYGLIQLSEGRVQQEGSHFVIKYAEVEVTVLSFRCQNGINTTEIYVLTSNGKNSYFEKNNDLYEYIHRHDGFELSYVLQGKTTYWLESEVYQQQKGEVFLINQNVIHKEQYSEDAVVIFIVIPTNYINDIVRENSISNRMNLFFLDKVSSSYKKEYLHYVPSKEANIDILIDMIVTELKKKQKGYPYMLKALLVRLLDTLENNEIYNSDLITEEISKSFFIFKRITDYLEKRMWDVTVKELTEEFHYNANYFNRIIRKFTNLSMVEYCIEHKFKYAEELLLKTDKNINEIVQILGYENKTYFFRTFAERYGMTPNEYRKMMCQDTQSTYNE